MEHMNESEAGTTNAVPKKPVPYWHPKQQIYGRPFYEMERKEAAVLLRSCRKDRTVKILQDVYGVVWYICNAKVPGDPMSGRLFVPRNTRKST